MHQADDTEDFQVANEDVQDEEDAIDVKFAKALLNHLRDWSGAIIDPQAAHHRGGASDVTKAKAFLKKAVCKIDSFCTSLEHPESDTMWQTKGGSAWKADVLLESLFYSSELRNKSNIASNLETALEI